MSLRYLAGFITASYNPLKVPNAPTIGTATAGDAQATITFTAPSNVGGGAITGYIAVATKTSDGTAVSATGSASPITITGLTNGSAYTIQVAAVNAFGPSAYSAPSNSVTPYAPKLYSWGINNQGELGQNNVIDRSSPVQVGADANWANISAKLGNSLATRLTNTIFSWGTNGSGQLGQNDRVYRSSPTQIGALTNWSIPSTSNGNFCFAVKTDGTLWSWGQNAYGQLGLNDRVYRSSPVQVGALADWATVDGGSNHTLAIKTTGTLWSWGENNRGQLGQNIAYTTNRSSPVQVGADTNWSKVAAGAAISFAVKTNGTLWSWGRNNIGQLGQNISYLVYRSSPVQVGALTTWANVSSAASFCVATQTNGTLWAWGANSAGQLGQNDRVYRSSPVQIGALTSWSSANAGQEQILAIQTNGTLWGWGRNNSGQLGLNDTVTRSSPVQVGSSATWVKVITASLFSMAI